MTDRLGLPRMTAYRMARTLLSAGHLVTDQVSGKYRLGPALLASTCLSESYAELVAMAQPIPRVPRRLDRRIRHTGGGGRRRGRLRRGRRSRSARTGAGWRSGASSATPRTPTARSPPPASRTRSARPSSARRSSDTPPRRSPMPTSAEAAWSRPGSWASPSTWRSATRAPAPAPRPSATRPARSSRRLPSSCPRAASTTRPGTRAPPPSGTRRLRSRRSSGTRGRASKPPGPLCAGVWRHSAARPPRPRTVRSSRSRAALLQA